MWKVGSQEIPGVTGKSGLRAQNETWQRLIEFCQENALVIANTCFQQHKRRLYTWTSPDGQYQNQMILFFATKDGEALYSQQKQDWELTVAQIQFSSVQLLSHVWLFATPWTAALQAFLSITNSNACPSSRWCHLTISSSVVPFSSCPQSFPASGSFQISQLLTSGGQSIGVSTSIPDLSMNTQDWSSLRLTSWICLQSKGFVRVFSNTTVQKHQFFGAQVSL